MYDIVERGHNINLKELVLIMTASYSLEIHDIFITVKI